MRPPLTLQGEVTEFPVNEEKYLQKHPPDAICSLLNTPLEKLVQSTEVQVSVFDSSLEDGTDKFVVCVCRSFLLKRSMPSLANRLAGY